MKKVTLSINDEFYAFARMRSNQCAMFGPEDYLTGLLNMELMREIVDAGNAVPLQGERVAAPGMRRYDAEENDDGFPF